MRAMETEYKKGNREYSLRENNPNKRVNKPTPAIRPNQLPVIPHVYTGKGNKMILQRSA